MTKSPLTSERLSCFSLTFQTARISHTHTRFFLRNDSPILLMWNVKQACESELLPSTLRQGAVRALGGNQLEV